MANKNDATVTSSSWKNEVQNGVSDQEPVARRSSRSGGEPMSPEHSSGSRSPRGPRLFTEVFALGCSVAFRWAAVSAA